VLLFRNQTKIDFSARAMRVRSILPLEPQLADRRSGLRLESFWKCAAGAIYATGVKTI
jgi:hypothetical protein